MRKTDTYGTWIHLTFKFYDVMQGSTFMYTTGHSQFPFSSHMWLISWQGKEVAGTTGPRSVATQAGTCIIITA